MPDDQDAKPGEQPRPDPSARARLLGSFSGNALVMDDEESVRVVCERLLTRLGFSVKTARHGAEALELVQDAVKAGKPFNVAILDLTIPGGLGGADIADRLRKESPSTRLVVSSGHQDQQASDEWDGRLAKPYRLDELAGVLKRALE